MSKAFYFLAALGLMSPLLYRFYIIGRNMHMQYYFEDYFSEDNARAYLQRTDQCNFQFEHVKKIYNVHTLDEANAMIAKHNEPLLFKHFIRDPERILQKVLDAGEHNPMNLTEVELHGFGNVFLGGATPLGPIEATVNEVLDQNYKYTDDDSKSIYASFLPLKDKLGKETLQELTPEGSAFDTDFASNFPYDILASSIHAAPFSHAYSFQIVGKKMWIFGKPALMEEFTPYNTPSTMVFGGSEKEFFEKTKGNVPIVVQEPGDFFFFPPHWPHSVITQAGPNLMFNFRVPVLNPLHHLKSGTLFRYMESIVALLVERSSGPRGHVFTHLRKKTSDLVKRRVMASVRRAESKNFDSPCTDFWRDIMHKNF